MYLLKDYDYELPENLISHQPARERETSRLLHMNRVSGGLCHQRFSDICDILLPNDLLVINNTKVIPARMKGKKETGGKVEVLILDYIQGMNNLDRSGNFECECLIKASKRPKNNTKILFENDLKAIVKKFEDGIYTLRFEGFENIDDAIDEIGEMPLPPYIKREQEKPPCDDRVTYQTVYASQKGAIAAPTAGLHFSKGLLEKLDEKGIETAPITLHVGYGTFVPVRVDDIRHHNIHTERYFISEETAEKINQTKNNGGRIIAVGTTSVRTLEYASDEKGNITSGSGSCDLFIYPGYHFKTVDAMITNFHLPKSTLLMLVSAFSSHENIFNAYRIAIEEKYKFYSYGDAMLIL